MEEKKYEEWQELPMDYDEKNPYTQRFTYPSGDIFYVEPVFHLKLQGFKMQRPESIDTILLEMERIVKQNHVVVFVGEEDYEITKDVEGAIYLTIQDVCNPLLIFVEDKSRGSDYGD